MLVNLDDLRPKNETQQHFFLKQIGKIFLYNQGCRHIASEVEMPLGDEPLFGTNKLIIDVVGITAKNRQAKEFNGMFMNMYNLAEELSEDKSIWRAYGKDVHKYEPLKKHYLELACKQLGYDRELAHASRTFYTKEYEIRSVEVKVSLSDFKNGYNSFAEYSYILAPLGIIPVKDLLPKVGLLEFDFDKFYKGEKWENCLSVKKKVKKQYDIGFYHKKDKKKFNHSYHVMECERILMKIAQQNTEEAVFWNPHIKFLDNKHYFGEQSVYHRRFKYNIGDKVGRGKLVADRKFDSRGRVFYKYLVEGKGYTGWEEYKEPPKDYSKIFKV